MPSAESGRQAKGAPKRRFATTRWSVILAAGQDSTVESRQALETLCKTYWHPLYFYVRRRGKGVEEAEDLIQGFFVRLLEKGVLEKADRERGRFRCFLQAALKNYLTNEWDKSRAKKRGEGRVHLSLDFETAERLYLPNSTQQLTPDILFDRQWALTLIDRSLARLQKAYAGSGKGSLFEELKGRLIGDAAESTYRDIGRGLDMTEGAVKLAVYRMRQRFNDCLREEIAQTASGPEEVEDELRALFSSFE
jgi:RNA polymerase sigma factor (sigma-70 family)